MDAGLPRYNTPSRYLDSTTKSPYGRTVVNQYLHMLHCWRRKVEEYSSSEVLDSDNNSIKEFVKFSKPSFRMNFAESSLEVTSDSHFSLEVALELYFLIQNADLLLFQNSDRKRERELFAVGVVVGVSFN